MGNLVVDEREALHEKLRWCEIESKDYRSQLIECMKRNIVYKAQLDVSAARQKELRDQLAAARDAALEGAAALAEKIWDGDCPSGTGLIHNEIRKLIGKRGRFEK